MDLINISTNVITLTIKIPNIISDATLIILYEFSITPSRIVVESIEIRRYQTFLSLYKVLINIIKMNQF